MFRRGLIAELRDWPITLSALPLRLEIEPCDLENDLHHLIHSARGNLLRPVVEAKRCRRCGFRFQAEKLQERGTYPRCKSTWISEPRIALEKRWWVRTQPAPGTEDSPPAWVECHAGDRADTEPQRLFLSAGEVAVTAVIDRWFDPKHRYFYLRGDGGGIYLVRHDTLSDRWELTLFDSGLREETRLSSI